MSQRGKIKIRNGGNEVDITDEMERFGIKSPMVLMLIMQFLKKKDFSNFGARLPRLEREPKKRLIFKLASLVE